MLSDYIPVYWPKTNSWSIPNLELEKYEDYVPEPQAIVLFKGHVVRGIPLLHFGTWGIMGVNVTKLIRGFAGDPEGHGKLYDSKKAGADAAAFFSALAKRYPKILHVRHFKGGRTPASRRLCVPADCIVKYVPERKP